MSQYPLPDGVTDDVFNVENMALAMNVSTVTISKWIDQGMPVQKRGGNGQSYELRFSHCYAWRKWRESNDRAARDGAKRRAEEKAQMFFGEEEAPINAGLTAKEVREWSEAELMRNKAALQRGELVRAAVVQTVLEDLLVSVRNAITSAPDFFEQEFSLSPAQVVKAEAYCDNLLIEIRKQISDAAFEAGDVVSITDRADSR